MDGDADRARLVGDGPRDRLPDPPRGIRRELEAAPVVELVDGAHETDVALLDQVQERKPSVHVLLGHRDDEAQVGLRQLLPCPVSLVASAAHRPPDTDQVRRALGNPGARLRTAFGPGDGVRRGGRPLAARELRRGRYGGGVHEVDQIAPEVGRERDIANRARDRDPSAKNAPQGTGRGTTAPLADALRPRQRVREILEPAADGIRAGEELSRALGLLALRQLRVRQRHRVAQRPRARTHRFRETLDVMRHGDAARERLHDAQLAALDALRDRHLTLARQQGHAAHLPQVRPHQVLALILLVHRKVHLAGTRHLAPLGVGHLLGAVDLDALALEVLEQGADVLHVEVGGGVIQHLIERQRPVALSQRHELRNDVLAFLCQQVQALLRSVTSGYRLQGPGSGAGGRSNFPP